ncbi:MAG TPA: beta-propeller domain-containing protein [Nocardioidaceae bacterium]|nr:beta-propeller domain-containing protein [Nocardioidaceae bacterium]
MARQVLSTVATGVTAGVATYALLASGVLGGTAGALVDATRSLVRPPAAAAAGLPGFDNCEQLRRWYVRAALPEVGPWGLGDGPVPLAAGRTDVSVPVGDAAPETAVGASGTGTNVQEAGVDEPDVAKTDGRVLVRISGHSLVVTDVSGERPLELSRSALPGREVLGTELLLHGERVLVVEGERLWPGGPVPLVDDLRRSWPPTGQGTARTRLLSFDISDPATPRLVDDRSLGGSLVSARLYRDGTVRLALASRAPALPFVQPGPNRSPDQATRANRRLVRAAPVGAWLPTVRSGAGEERPLVACDEVRHPVRGSGPGTVSVLTFAADAPELGTATAVTAAGDLVYSSEDRLYVATQSGRSTSVHAFALDVGRTSYAASGSVPGFVKDRWSFSEHDRHLRVATTTVSTASRWSSSGVRVLAERGDRLEETGHVDGLGVDEQVMSVRWFGDLAVVVTFRQTDPLYTVDLSDPARPRLLGELKVPGFSSYLHPVGGDLLVGLGRDATTTGIDRGAQASTFDLHDLADVRRTDTLDLGRDTWLPGSEDPRAVSYLPDERLLVTAEWSWREGRSRFVALHVSAAGELTLSRSWPLRPGVDAATRVLPVDGGRVALVDVGVRLVRPGQAG